MSTRDLWPFNVYKDFPSENSLFRVDELIKNADPDKYKYSGFGIGFDACENFRCLMVVELVKI